MARQHRGNSPSKSLTRSGRSENVAKLNLERCLRALDQRGEEGLQKELDRLYPESPLQSVILDDGKGMRLHATMLRKPAPVKLVHYSDLAKQSKSRGKQPLTATGSPAKD